MTVFCNEDGTIRRVNLNTRTQPPPKAPTPKDSEPVILSDSDEDDCLIVSEDKPQVAKEPLPVVINLDDDEEEENNSVTNIRPHPNCVV